MGFLLLTRLETITTLIFEHPVMDNFSICDVSTSHHCMPEHWGVLCRLTELYNCAIVVTALLVITLPVVRIRWWFAMTAKITQHNAVSDVEDAEMPLSETVTQFGMGATAFGRLGRRRP
jgi:hypothetical protein